VAEWRSAGQPIELVRSLNNLGNVLSAHQEPAAAIACFAEARSVLAGAPSLFEQAMIDLSLGTLLFNLGRVEEAEAAFRCADSPRLRRSAHLRYRALAANNLGNVLLAQGRLAEAEAYLRGALSLWPPLQAPVMEANALGTLGEVLARQGRPHEALAAYDQALDQLRSRQEVAFARRLTEKFSRLRAELLANGLPGP
jgi:tetratricopeptide (TPR) repeat protein